MDGIKFSEEAQIDLPPNRRFLPVEYRDWNRIKKNIKEIDFRSSRWENAGWFCLSAVISLGVNIFLSPDYGGYFLLATIFGVILTSLCFIIAYMFSESTQNLQNEVTKDMDEIESSIIKPEQVILNKLSIVSATYGVEGSELDISKELTDKILDNTLNIKIDNSIKGDPALGIKKRGIINYFFSGLAKKVEIQEGDYLNIP